MFKRHHNVISIVDKTEHRINATNAATWYIECKWMTVEELARAFRVSENTINTWFCEAVANNYIVSAPLCNELIKKHLAEYETKHNLKNSSLRQMYKEAITTRNAILSIKE